MNVPGVTLRGDGAHSPSSPDLTRCLECGHQALLVGGRAIYPHRPDLYAKSFWRCECGAYVGCHPGTKDPLGFPAGPATRKARSAAHAAFDPLWKRGGMRRSDAYKWLADQFGQHASVTHISWMDAAQAALVVGFVAARASGPASPLGNSGNTPDQDQRP